MNKKYFLGVLFIVFAILLFFTPFALLVNYRYDDWIFHIEKTKIAGAVIIGGVYGFFVFKGALKKVAPLSSTLITTIIMTVITLLIKSIIVDLPYIFGSITIGLALFIIFYKIGARLIEKAKIYSNEKIRQTARTDMIEETTRMRGRI